MILIIADCHLLQQNRQAFIDMQLMDTKQQVMKHANKLIPQIEGPFTIITIITNVKSYLCNVTLYSSIKLKTLYEGVSSSGGPQPGMNHWFIV